MPTIYLTFDDGPTAHTPRLLDVLSRYSVPATFFIVGKRIAGNENILRMVHAAGHSLGNHSFGHLSAQKMDYAELASDMDRCSELIRHVIPGWQSNLYRPPYGDLSLGLIRFALARRARIIMWSLDSIDYRAETPDIIDQRLAGLKNGDILLFHDEFAVTALTLDRLIPRCLDRGYRFACL